MSCPLDFSRAKLRCSLTISWLTSTKGRTPKESRAFATAFWRAMFGTCRASSERRRACSPVRSRVSIPAARSWVRIRSSWLPSAEAAAARRDISAVTPLYSPCSCREVAVPRCNSPPNSASCCFAAANTRGSTWTPVSRISLWRTVRWSFWYSSRAWLYWFCSCWEGSAVRANSLPNSRTRSRATTKFRWPNWRASSRFAFVSIVRTLSAI
ncbi:hypothetical protein D9M68_408370 [compost metagenome]